MEAIALEVSDRHRRLACAYPMTVLACDDGDGYEVDIPDWPYITGVGDTPAEALETAIEGVAGALALGEEHGLPSPEPLSTFSGELHLHVPATLHRALAAKAKAEGITLDSTATMLLALALGAESTGVRAA